MLMGCDQSQHYNFVITYTVLLYLDVVWFGHVSDWLNQQVLPIYLAVLAVEHTWQIDDSMRTMCCVNQKTTQYK